MLDSFWFSVIVGCVLGFLSGLGVGGGSLLLLWLTLVLDAPQEHARLMNLMFFVPCAIVASLFRWKQGKLDRHLTFTAIGAGLVGSVIGNLLGRQLDLTIMRKIFGLLFILCGIRELRYREKPKEENDRE